MIPLLPPVDMRRTWGIGSIYFRPNLHLHHHHHQPTWNNDAELVVVVVEVASQRRSLVSGLDGWIERVSGKESSPGSFSVAKENGRVDLRHQGQQSVSSSGYG